MDAARLAKVPLFAELDEVERATLASAASEVEASTGQPIAVQGDFGHALYAIEEGNADVLVDGEKVRSLGPGDVFGEVAVVVSGRRTASVVATSQMKLLAFFKRDVWALEKSSPELAERLRELVAERVASSR
jgi:CPA1 family monovalent cation:H+ antiporter